MNKCKQCNQGNNRKSEFCSRGCYSKHYSKNNRDTRNIAAKSWRDRNPEKVAKYIPNILKWKQNKRAEIKKNTPNKICKNCYEEFDHRGSFCSKKCYHKIFDARQETILSKQKWRIDNRENHNLATKIRAINDLNFRLERIFRGRIYQALKHNLKGASTIELIGCSVQELRKHLESQFLSKMTWSNYGVEWEIDHIKSCHTYNLINLEGQKECFNWSNQRPLWKTTEIAKKYGYNNIIGNRNRDKKIKIEVKQW